MADPRITQRIIDDAERSAKIMHTADQHEVVCLPPSQYKALIAAARSRITAEAQRMLQLLATPERQPDPGQQWKCGDQFLPFHPQASHVPPEYRDGWNRCYLMAVARAATQEGARVPLTEASAEDIVQLACKWYDTGAGKDNVEHELAMAVMRYKREKGGN